MERLLYHGVVSSVLTGILPHPIIIIVLSFVHDRNISDDDDEVEEMIMLDVIRTSCEEERQRMLAWQQVIRYNFANPVQDNNSTYASPVYYNNMLLTLDDWKESDEDDTKMWEEAGGNFLESSTA